MIKTVIVDDEIASQEVIKELASKFNPELEIVGCADDTFEAEKLIELHKPDLLLLDIEMPRRSGISFLQQYPNPEFNVIFITAFNSYAIEALKLSALDYLLKPIDIEEFASAISKVYEKRKTAERLANLSYNLNNDNKKIALSQADAIDFVYLGEILYCIADGSYTEFYLSNGKVITTSKPIGYYSNVLNAPDFFRCHKSYIIRVDKITRYERNGVAILLDGSKIPVSRSNREFFTQILSRDI